jgi:hypothetical protein
MLCTSTTSIFATLHMNKVGRQFFNSVEATNKRHDTQNPLGKFKREWVLRTTF